MLATLSIKNFVLIEDAELELAAGLNVLTGETGAGKTLMTKALGLLMGERAEEGLIGTRGSDASIQAEFELSEREVEDLPEDIAELVGGVEPGPLIIARRLGKGGRNRCFINDTSVTLGALSSVVGGLLSFAGQHEYRRLLDVRYQLAVLDEWAGEKVLRYVAEFREAYDKARDAKRHLEEMRREEENRLREIDLLRFQVNELSQAGLSRSEEEELIAEQKRLSRSEDILKGASVAAGALNCEDDGTDAALLLGQAISSLSGLEGLDPELDGLAGSLAEVSYQVEELARELHSYADRVAIDPGRLEVVNERLRAYTELSRKYGGTTESAVSHLQESVERLSQLEGAEEDVSRLEEVQAIEGERALSLAAELSEQRARAIPRLESAIADELSGLGMADAVVRVRIQTGSDWGSLKETGADSVEFMLTANPGQPERSLGKTASGGELSRVLLAIKCALAGAGGGETLVFDEVDAGIGGRTAVAVGNKLRELGRRSQLLVITHLAQVAAQATRHFLIDKVSGADDTVARLTALKETDVVSELCRMLGGRGDDRETMTLAEQMRDRALAGLLD